MALPPIEYEVVRIVPESQIITSFYLRAKAPLARSYVPGEYLLFVHEKEGEEKVQREYSISGEEDGLLRITLKHELSPDGVLPDGRMSSIFHREISEGDCVQAVGPMGKFLLKRDSDLPVVLLSGGVGLTPVVSMAHELAQDESRKTLFIHACDNSNVHAMGAEMRTLASKHDNFQTHFLYREPASSDQQGRDYDTKGMVDESLLKDLVPDMNCEFYLCGPGPFMEAVYELLCNMGADPERISYEYFGTATVLKPKTGSNSKKKKIADSAAPKIVFAKSGVTEPWDVEIENLLEFAEEHDVAVDFSCRAGSCDSCKTRVISGNVHYAQEPVERPPEGYALLCCATPDGDLELDA